MNEQTPFGFFPGNPGGNFPNQPNQCNCSRELRNVTNRINNIERQMNRLERRVRRLEMMNITPFATPASASQESMTASYNDDNYIL